MFLSEIIGAQVEQTYSSMMGLFTDLFLYRSVSLFLPHETPMSGLLGRHEVKRSGRSIAVTISCAGSGSGSVVSEI